MTSSPRFKSSQNAVGSAVLPGNLKPIPVIAIGSFLFIILLHKIIEQAVGVDILRVIEMEQAGLFNLQVLGEGAVGFR